MALTDLIRKLKTNEVRIPIWLGQVISYWPYSYRPIIGQLYRKRMNEIEKYTKMSVDERQAFIFKRMKYIVEYAVHNVTFYKEYYAKQEFSPDQLKSFDDIKQIPIIDKSILMAYSLGERSNEYIPKFQVNTGGSSGVTLSFYVPPSSIANEWAHIHIMWGMLGFKPSDLKLHIVGRSMVKNGVDYEFARHTFSVDMYKPFPSTAPLLKKKLKDYPCFYLHGYPSVLSEFAEYCATDKELLALLKGKLRGAFLGSEYPYPMYRDTIEKVFGIRTQSFYGHTERCVMAYETDEKFRFVPFQTYGFTEALDTGNGHFDLVGTAYYNQASPLIRYNSKDVIDNPKFEGDIVTSFDIFEGRSGQFITDRRGKKISLTGLIMGRHHAIFGLCSHIQISQNEAGKAIIYYVVKKGCRIEYPSILFDVSNVEIDFSFEEKSEPIRTVSGKINLLV